MALRYRKKLFLLPVIFIFALGFAFALQSCVDTNAENNGKLKIVATLFPQYDFARQIAGDKADVILLLPPGSESHSFDPKPGDMLKINNAGLFLYTGKDMEPWAETILKGISNKNLTVIDCSKNTEMLDYDGHDGDHDHGADPHIWLNPENAVKIVGNILAALCEKDPENADFYRKNAEDYTKKLQKLNGDIREAIKNAERNIIVFGGRFAYIYFLEHFELDYVTAYDSCSSHDEPNAAKISQIIKFIRENNIPCIYYEELSDPKVARKIAGETNIKCLQFSTAHNVSKDEFDAGITFLDIMYANLENLKKGLY